MGASVVGIPGLYSKDPIVVVHRLSCSEAWGIFPDQGSNLCPLHWQVNSYPLHHQGRGLQKSILIALENRKIYSIKV